MTWSEILLLAFIGSHFVAVVRIRRLQVEVNGLWEITVVRAPQLHAELHAEEEK